MHQNLKDNKIIASVNDIAISFSEAFEGKARMLCILIEADL